MKGKMGLKILPGVILLLVFSVFLLKVFVEPWLGKKIQAELNEWVKDYTIEIQKVHILEITAGLELEMITIDSKNDQGDVKDLNGKISSIKLKGINLIKAIFKKDFDIREVIISNSSIKGKIRTRDKTKPPVLSPLKIRIGKVLINNMDLVLENDSTAQAFSVKQGVLKLYDLQLNKQETISPGITRQFDFESEELIAVSPDSNYTFKAGFITYSAASNTLVIDSFSIQPNYSGYDFTSRYKYETDCIEAVFSNICIHGFPAMTYFKSGSLISSYIEFGEMNVNIFRDKRKEFRHVNKPAFQDMIYNYPDFIRIDSIGMINGNVTYTEHAEEANEPGNIRFNKIRAKIYKITNDTIYKSENASLELKIEALLMGKGKMAVLLKAKLFDSQNTFSLNGTLSDQEAEALNPMLEKNAFVYATSGKIDVMNFSFSANNTKATGKMTMLYHGLDLAVKNRSTDDTTAFKERLSSLIANVKVMDSNPLPGKEVREGVIDYERDPEKFLFNYCFKSIFSGIKSTLAKSTKEKRNS